MSEVKRIHFTQNVDRSITKQSYSELGDDTLLVTSMFRTIQGEGPYAGYPAVFLRLAGCNFGAKTAMCQFCDTSFEFDKGTQHKLVDLACALDELAQPGDILVITGGEPTLQHNLHRFYDLVWEHAKFLTIQVETNGSQASFFAVEDSNESEWYVDYVVSPKASYKTKTYGKISDVVLERASALKFVLDADPESPHHTIPDWAFKAKDEYQFLLYVSPMCEYLREYKGEVSSIWEEGLIDKVKTARNYNYAAKYALEHNLKLSTQQHLFIGVA